MLQEPLQGGYALLQCLPVFGILRGAHRQRPGEHRQYEQTAGQAAPLAQLPGQGVGVLLQGLHLGFEGVEAWA
jgi:hypothetical protein